MKKSVFALILVLGIAISTTVAFCADDTNPYGPYSSPSPTITVTGH